MKVPLFAIVFSWFMYCMFSTHALSQPLNIKEVTPEPYVYSLKRTGKLVFDTTVSLSFKTSGFLSEINVDEGDTFTAGQVLAQLDTAELIAEKNATYARLLQAKQDVKRTEALLAQNLSSKQAVDDAKTLVETARSHYQIAQFNLQKAKLIAPFNGIVVQRYSELEELQNTNQAVLKLAASENNLAVKVAVTGYERGLLVLNQPITVKQKHLGNLAGVITMIPVEANPQSQLFMVEASLTTPIRNPAIGMLVEVLLEITSDYFIYKLPLSALNSVDNEGNAVITQVNKSTSLSDERYTRASFSIVDMNNNYIYLSAEQSTLPLAFVNTGWQTLMVAPKGTK